MWYEPIIIVFIQLHIATAAYTLYAHRGMAHGHFNFHPALEHVMRFTLWFTRAFAWKGWVRNFAALHRKHHTYPDIKGVDPHSPYEYTFGQMFSNLKAEAYDGPHYISTKEAHKWTPDLVDHDDWIENNLYTKYPKLGLLIIWVTLTVIYGWAGFITAGLAWYLPKHLGVFIGSWLPHKFGLKHFKDKEKDDRSRNVSPWGLWWAGEEIHENHHKWPGAWNFARRWYEFDIGYWYARIFMWCGLMSVRNAPYRPDRSANMAGDKAYQ